MHPGPVKRSLRRRDIDHAIAVVCVEDSELWNLETALIAGEMRPDVRVIAQVGNATVNEAMNDDTHPGVVLDIADLAVPSVVEACLGITMRGTPDQFAAMRIPLVRPSAISDTDRSAHLVRRMSGGIRELVEDVASHLVHPADVRRGHHHGHDHGFPRRAPHNPPAVQTLGRGKARFMRGHVVVIGLGAFGIRVAQELKARGRDVVIIERFSDNRFMSAARRSTSRS